ncbi:L-ectoine synthase, partial [Paraburkholderia azotifigens]
MAVEDMGWQVLAGLPHPKSHTLAFRFGSARKPRFYKRLEPVFLRSNNMIVRSLNDVEATDHFVDW